MANFTTHLNVAFALSSVAALGAFKAGLVDSSQFVLCAALGTVGGLLPDIDSDHSTPLKLGFDISALVVAFAAVIHWRGALSLSALLLLWLLCFILFRYGVLKVFTKLTVHRGIIHSVPYMAVLALLLVDYNVYILHTPALIGWFYGGFLLFGALIHLLLDEIYSVNLLGMRIKRSFGTAFKLFGKRSPLGYALLYAILAVLIVLAPPFMPFWHKVSDPLTWWLLQSALLPHALT